MSNLLLVDIGGTNMRHAISSSDSNEITDICKTVFSDMTEFEDKLENLIKENSIDELIASVAGPKINECIAMTNRDYIFNTNEITKKFNLKKCYLLNDWEAIAHSFDYVCDSIINIKEGESYNNTVLYLGPGTGLGASVAINNQFVLATEVGNTTNSTKSLLNNFNIESNTIVTLENIISGSAISNIYKLKANTLLTSEEILDKYVQKDPIAIDVMDGFIKSLAQSLSDLALTFNSGGGILLAGSLMRSLYPMIDKNDFYKNFMLNKFDSHIDMLNLISIGVITKECSPLYGNLSFYKKLKN